MSANDFQFLTYWRVPGTLEDVAAILRDQPGLPRWWPAAYLAVREVEPGDAAGLGQVLAFVTQGRLPAPLHWQARVVDVHPNGFILETWGDLVGRCLWTYVQDGPDVLIVNDWQIGAGKPLGNFAGLTKPLFAANHRWAMARGEESLKLELARRQVATAAERALVPAPPPATPSARQIARLAAGLAGLAGLGWWWRRRRQRP